MKFMQIDGVWIDPEKVCYVRTVRGLGFGGCRSGTGIGFGRAGDGVGETVPEIIVDTEPEEVVQEIEKFIRKNRRKAEAKK